MFFFKNIRKEIIIEKKVVATRENQLHLKMQKLQGNFDKKLSMKIITPYVYLKPLKFH